MKEIKGGMDMLKQQMNRRSSRIVAVGLVLLCFAGAEDKARIKAAFKIDRAAISQTAILWKDPGAISSRDLYYGMGGKERAPRGPFTFVKEDTGATQPKFVVRDASGAEWRVKLGEEAKCETAATRLIWSVGYFTDEDYVVPSLQVVNMPRLRRFKNDPQAPLENARMERSPMDAKFEGHWKWEKNPFSGTRELNGLKILMALVNNWDMKNNNTTVYSVVSTQPESKIYLVGDVGATFGKDHYNIHPTKSDPDEYRRSKFLTRVSDKTVSFRSPGRPPLLNIFFIPHFFVMLWETDIRSLTRDIPRKDARWMGDLLSQLSEKQVLSAFEAAGYTPEEARAFANVVLNRIAQLRDL